MKKSKCIGLCVIGVAILSLGASAQATMITVDADAFAAGTVLTNAFAGVTLTTRDGVAPGTNVQNVRSETDANATTGTRVFAQANGSTLWGNGDFEFLRADFASGTTKVLLDFAANDSSDSNAELLAFDSSGTLVDSDAVLGLIPLGSPVTLTVEAPNIAYIAAYWDNIARLDNGVLDNLRYEVPSQWVIPEPLTMTCVLLAVGAVGTKLRRRLS